MSKGLSELLTFLISNHRYDEITEYANCVHPDKNQNVVVTGYTGSDLRVCTSDKDIKILCPLEPTQIQESALTKAIEDGTIFDDAATIDRTSKYIELTTLPHRGISNCGKESPKNLHIVISLVIGKMNEDGRCEVNDVDIQNGCNFVKDVFHHKSTNNNVHQIVNDYLNKQEDISITKSVREKIGGLDNEIDDIDDIKPEYTIRDDDYEEIDVTPNSVDDDVQQEGFFTKKPKKLKPIPRDIIAYITVEIGAIKDSNDQAMLCGYTCSKLELVDFYLNVLDTNDERYIVPHTRDYLVWMQTELNKLLTKILNIRPINKNDRMWRLNYPQ